MEQTGPSSNLLLPSLSTYLNQRPADFFVFPGRNLAHSGTSVLRLLSGRCISFNGS